MSKKRRAFAAEFKAKVALEAVKEQETINQIASRYNVLPAQVSQWKKHLLESLPGTFKGGGRRKDPEVEWEQEKEQFYQKIGLLEMERDWLKKNLNSSVSSPEAKRAMIDKQEKLPRLDNVFVERFWRILKYEEVYRREYSGIANARGHLAAYFETYNTRRPHSSLNDRTPARVHAEIQVHQAA